MIAPTPAPTIMPTGPAAAPPMIAPLANPAPPRFAPPSIGGFAKAVFAARLIASRPAIIAGLRNLVVQVPICLLQCVKSRFALEAYYAPGSGLASGRLRAGLRQIVANNGDIPDMQQKGTRLLSVDGSSAAPPSRRTRFSPGPSFDWSR